MATLGPKMLNTANRTLWWVPTIANIKAPTALEINAGINMTCMVTAANYQFGITGNEQITDPALCDAVSTSAPGQATVEAAMDFFRFKNTADDKPWTTFTGAGIAGYLVERVGQLAAGVAPEDHPATANDEVQVLYVLTNDPQVQSPSTAGYEKFRMVFSPQKHAPRAKVA